MFIKKSNKRFSGELNPHSKLSNDAVKSIKELLINGESPTIIAKEMNIKRQVVYSIKYGRNWKNI